MTPVRGGGVGGGLVTIHKRFFFSLAPFLHVFLFLRAHVLRPCWARLKLAILQGNRVPHRKHFQYQVSYLKKNSKSATKKKEVKIDHPVILVPHGDHTLPSECIGLHGVCIYSVFCSRSRVI